MVMDVGNKYVCLYVLFEDFLFDTWIGLGAMDPLFYQIYILNQDN